MLIHYLIIRRDLQFGHTLAQLVHAAAESTDGGHHTVAVLGVRDERTLKKLERKLKANNIPHTAIREPDPPFNGGLAAIGVRPGERETLAPYFRKLQTYRRLNENTREAPVSNITDEQKFYEECLGE